MASENANVNVRKWREDFHFIHRVGFECQFWLPPCIWYEDVFIIEHVGKHKKFSVIRQCFWREFGEFQSNYLYISCDLDYKTFLSLKALDMFIRTYDFSDSEFRFYLIWKTNKKSYTRAIAVIFYWLTDCCALGALGMWW